MPVVPFARYLANRDLSFGLRPGLLEEIGSRTSRGEGVRELLNDQKLAASGIGPLHLLPIRRALRRYQVLAAESGQLAGEVGDAVTAAGLRWAARIAGPDAQNEQLGACFACAARVTLERGRLRLHLTHPDDPRSVELESLAEHSEGCADIPPHRWFTAARGVSLGLLWIEVIPPDDEIERCLAPADRTDLLADLRRAIERSVLSEIGAGAERLAISAAAEALRSLLSRPPVAGPVAGLAADGKRIFACLLHPGEDAQQADFGLRDLAGAVVWLAARKPNLTGLACLSGSPDLSPLYGHLSGAGLLAEPAREAGLMKQARRRPGSIKPAAARVVAERLADPLVGYADLEPDQLGLGEYLDRVDAVRLREALGDIREAVVWEREKGGPAAPEVRGLQINPMVKSIADLKPGMELSGVVANLASFGAFVELGLGTQGLVHLSELSDEFAAKPVEVVGVGQRVTVRVVEVDAARGRISLSLRRERRGAPGGKRGRRSAALRDLDKLFK
ncbi:MAG TPA: S1 RNA-binding domain-containing protein [Myxococcota bacterium]|nr:S1 RNA-binding domain-containing protein [Myxococcota bacterium]